MKRIHFACVGVCIACVTIYLVGRRNRGANGTASEQRQECAAQTEKPKSLSARYTHRRDTLEINDEIDPRDRRQPVAGQPTQPDDHRGHPLESVLAKRSLIVHPLLESAASSDDLVRALACTSVEDIRTELANRDLIWSGSDEFKRCVTAEVGLIAATVGATTESYQRVPDLFAVAASNEVPSNRDVATLYGVRLGILMRDKRARVDDDSFDCWMNIARSPNVVYRLISILLLERVELRPEQTERLIVEFFNEDVVVVAAAAVNAIEEHLDTPQAVISLIERFSLSKAGACMRIELAEKIRKLKEQIGEIPPSH